MIGEIKEKSNIAWLFLKKYAIVFILVVVVFILLYVYLAESARRKALEGRQENYQDRIDQLEDEISETKKDFYNLQKEIDTNDSIFFNRPVDVLDVNELINKMSDRFEADGIPVVQDDRKR